MQVTMIPRRIRGPVLPLCVLVAIALVLLSGCEWGGDDTVTPVETLFRKTVGEPMSITATGLQGYGHTWQGYSVYLRFVPSKPLVDILIKEGYTETPFKEIVATAGGFSEIEPRFRDRFSPPWCPSSVKHPRFFSKEVSNRWTPSGAHYFLVDEDTGLVYFHGSGS